jgi:predicted kinase
MRKWMRERLQRRKKKDPEPEGTAPAPLQPAYFDAEQSAPEAAGHETGAAAATPDIDSAPEPSAEAPADASPVEKTRSSSSSSSRSRTAASDSPSSRGRRRRGGRGRTRGREQGVAQAFTPAVGKGIPASPGEDGAQSLEGEAPGADPEVSGPRTPAATAAPREPRGVVVLAIGLPGSGKSSWFKRHSVTPLSSDMVRSLLFDDVREQRFQDLVFSNLRSMLKARLIAKRPMNYVDATNLTPQERQHWIKLAKDYGYEVHAVFFDVPLEVCLDRHQRRDRVVPEDVMRRMASKLKPPAFEEGFAKITVVRVKKKDDAQPEASA